MPNHSVNHKCVCRTAPVTPSLLVMYKPLIFVNAMGPYLYQELQKYENFGVLLPFLYPSSNMIPLQPTKNYIYFFYYFLGKLYDLFGQNYMRFYLSVLLLPRISVYRIQNNFLMKKLLPNNFHYLQNCKTTSPR